jgi:hypothetical protein
MRVHFSASQPPALAAPLPPNPHAIPPLGFERRRQYVSPAQLRAQTRESQLVALIERNIEFNLSLRVCHPPQGATNLHQHNTNRLNYAVWSFICCPNA